jgi:hypothetical protein
VDVVGVVVVVVGVVVELINEDQAGYVFDRFIGL